MYANNLLEPDAGKLARPVLRGGRRGNAASLPDRIVVIASFAGAPHHPGWYHNLVANPEVTLEIGTERFRARAEVTSGEERQRLFDAQAAQMPIFHDYQKKTSRQIPVVVFNRID